MPNNVAVLGDKLDKTKKKNQAIVDTHRHPIGPKLAAKMAERGFYDPKQAFPQTNAQDLIGYREFYDLEYAMPKSREEGETLSLASNGARRNGLRETYFKSAPATPSRS